MRVQIDSDWKLTLNSDAELAILIVAGFCAIGKLEAKIRLKGNNPTIGDNVSSGNGNFGVLNTGSDTNGALVNILKCG
jgi:hypothetical protein